MTILLCYKNKNIAKISIIFLIKRELKEETGYTGGKILNSQNNLYIDPWKSNIKSGFVTVEISENQTPVQNLDHDENIKVKFIRCILLA